MMDDRAKNHYLVVLNLVCLCRDLLLVQIVILVSIGDRHSHSYNFPMQPTQVLLLERKRHTARRVASARYAALSPNGGGGVPHPVLDRGGYPIQSLIRGGTLSSPG